MTGETLRERLRSALNTLRNMGAPAEECEAVDEAISEIARLNTGSVPSVAAALAAARAEERERWAREADRRAEQNRKAAAEAQRRANRLGDDPFGHGDMATGAAAELTSCANECAALAAAIRGAEAPDLAAENERLRSAVAAFVAWLEAEDNGPDYGSLTRDTHPEGERIWREWWNRNLRLCDRAQTLGRAALEGRDDG